MNSKIIKMKKIKSTQLFIAAVFFMLPFVGSCQEFNSASWNEYKTDETINEYGRSIQMLLKPERPDWSISTDSIPVDDMPTGEWNTHTYAVDSIPTFSGISTAGIYILSGRSVKTKTDTVLVDVLCTKMIYSDNPALIVTHKEPKQEYVFTYATKIRQERTLEWETWNSNTSVYAVYIPKSDWVVTSTKWLDLIEGCYQLIPLKE